MIDSLAAEGHIIITESSSCLPATVSILHSIITGRTLSGGDGSVRIADPQKEHYLDNPTGLLACFEWEFQQQCQNYPLSQV